MSNVEDGSNSDDGGQSSTPTQSSHLHRNLGSSWSAADTPSHHHQGTYYFNFSVSPSSTPSYSAAATRPTPILMRSSSGHSIRRGLRSTSVSSTARGFRDNEAFSEVEEYGEETADSQRRSAAGKAVSIDDEPHADSSDEQEQEQEQDTPRDGEGPITLKERQSLMSVGHPLGM